MARGGKGKISNDLVAASCAAVLAVYAVGYVRTRDAARRFETHARKLPLAVRAPAPSAAAPAPTATSAPAAASAVQSHRNDTAASALPDPAPGSRNSAPTIPKARGHAPTAAGASRRPAPAVAAQVSAPVQASVPEGSSAAAVAQVPAVAPVPLPEEIASRAPASATASKPPATPQAKWRDGTYTGDGDSPHGDIEARVVIKNGRIVEAGISACNTRYPCSVIDSLIQQPVELQGPIVDYVSHATESSYAYYDALVEALKSALEEPPAETAGAK